ncbi:MAG: GMC family oxidoreductase [Verrucomicrobiota bacterium]
MDWNQEYDVIIIGTGAGGSAVGWALQGSGKSVLFLETGDFIPQEADNWSPEANFKSKKYYERAPWFDVDSNSFFQTQEVPAVGGKTKVWGNALSRFTPETFDAYEEAEGLSPAWPISYEILRPFYEQAEQLYKVHGDSPEIPYAYPGLPYDSEIRPIVNTWEQLGFPVKKLPLALDVREQGRCTPCQRCVGYVCKVHGKCDADVTVMRPLLEKKDFQLLTGATAKRLIPFENKADRIDSVEIQWQGQTRQLKAKQIVVSCGAVNSSLLFMKSKSKTFPEGLANSSGLLGKNLMFHNIIGLGGIRLTHRPFLAQSYQKLFQIDFPVNQGKANVNFQAIGAAPLEHVAGPPLSWMPHIARFLNKRTLLMTMHNEDLPKTGNCVRYTEDRVEIQHEPNNDQYLLEKATVMKSAIRKAGFPIVVMQNLIGSKLKMAYASGTMRFGNSPNDSVLDSNCRCHDLENVYVADSSFFPSAGSHNIGLTVIANGLRVGSHLKSL